MSRLGTLHKQMTVSLPAVLGCVVLGGVVLGGVVLVRPVPGDTVLGRPVDAEEPVTRTSASEVKIMYIDDTVSIHFILRYI